MGFLRIFIVLFVFFSPQAFSSSKKCQEAVSSSSETQSTELKIDPLFFIPVEEILLSGLSTQILKKHQVYYIGDLVRKTEVELTKMFRSEEEEIRDYISAIASVEYGTVSEEIYWQKRYIKRNLSELNLQLGMDIDWPSEPEELRDLMKKHNQIIMERLRRLRRERIKRDTGILA